MICAAANPSVDTTFVVKHVDLGAVHRASAHARVAGGKGLNVARAAKRLGAQPIAVALTPEHGVAWLRSELAREGIELDTVEIPGQLRRCLSVLDSATGALTEFYEDGEPAPAQGWRSFHDAVLNRVRAGEWVTLSGSLPPGSPDDAYAELARAAAQRGARIALDANGRALEIGVSAGPDLIKVNEAEARGALGRDSAGIAETDEALELAAGLRAASGRPEVIAIVTRGERGAVLAGPDGIAIASAPELSAGLHPVGSGDAFLAGLLTRIAAGSDWGEALRFALAAGAANAAELGPACLDRDWAEASTQRVRVTRS
jgi:1-phosphofructokinase family hexose kinase